MWMKLIVLLVICICTSAIFVQKRSSVLTDESKRILDIFDFSNFDKQEALGYIDRQRFDNLIRGKRSKWNLKQNLCNSNLGFTDYEEYNLQRKKFDSNGAEKMKYSFETILKNDKLKLNSRSDFQFDEGKMGMAERPGLRRARNAKQFESDNLRQKGYGLHENGNISSIEENEFHDINDNDHYAEDKGEMNCEYENRRSRGKKKKRHHWSKWSEWSPCSVTCGKGRKIRSRKCIAKSCVSGEIEMGEKTCQLPACSLFDKLFSFLA